MSISNADLDTYDQLLCDFQPDLRFIVRKYRKNFHALSEEEIVSEINRRLIAYKDKYIFQDDPHLHKDGFVRFAYTCAKNAVFWTAKGASKRDKTRNQCTTPFSFIEERGSDFDAQSFFAKNALNAAQEESFLDSAYPPAKINNIIKWITEYSDFLDERESIIFKKLMLGQTHQEISESIGVTRQMISLIATKIFEKIQDNIKIKINTDSSLVKLKKGLKAINYLF
jgi:RNA polymerase sigma factor (sigma-70 family)